MVNSGQDGAVSEGSRATECLEGVVGIVGFCGLSRHGFMALYEVEVLENGFVGVC